VEDLKEGRIGVFCEEYGGLLRYPIFGFFFRIQRQRNGVRMPEVSFWGILEEYGLFLGNLLQESGFFRNLFFFLIFRNLVLGSVFREFQESLLL
jgi:hypothetical protein